MEVVMTLNCHSATDLDKDAPLILCLLLLKECLSHVTVFCKDDSNNWHGHFWKHHMVVQTHFLQV